MAAHAWFLFVLILAHHFNAVTPIVYSCDPKAECGCSKTAATLTKIVGGESAVDSSWGWAVSLQRALGNTFCGGMIISPLHILTAAHCIVNASAFLQRVKVVVGVDSMPQSATAKAQVRSVVRIFSHPTYNEKTQENDIAILRLNESLIISNDRGTAQLCLPNVLPKNGTSRYPMTDSSLVAIGWGTLKYQDTATPSDLHLQQVMLNVMGKENPMCQLTIGNPQLQFCAAVLGGGKDTCQGDSGGPIMHFESKQRRWVLAGVTSYGRDCAHPLYAGVYTRVSVYQDWIKSIVTDRFFEQEVSGANSLSTYSIASVLSSCCLLLRSLPIFSQQ